LYHGFRFLQVKEALMRSIWIQFGVVALAAATLTMLINQWHFRSGLNVLWMLGIPVCVTLVANRGERPRKRMGIALALCSPLVSIGTAAALGHV
jgi:hypothetical protein